MTVEQRRQLEREARRNRILDAAQRVFYDKGLDAAKMGDVAKQAQLGKGTLYLYFNTKQELLLALAVRHQKAMIEAFEQIVQPEASGIVVLRRLLSAYGQRMSEPLEHLKLVVSRWAQAEPYDMETRDGTQMRDNVQRLFGIVVSSIERGQQDGSVRDDIAAAQLATHVWASVHGGLLMQLTQHCLKQHPVARIPSIEEHIDVVLDLARPAYDRTPRQPVVAIEEAG